MQTELVAILQALRYTEQHEIGPVVIHTDSLSAIQALQILKIKENKNLLSNIHLLLIKHKNQNRKVTLNWIPSHIGIPGNEEADKLAKQTNQLPHVQFIVQQSLQQIKNKTKHIHKKTLKENINFWINNNSRSAKWYYSTTELIPAPIDRNTPRELAVIVHRLRLGYKANWEIIENTNKPCKHCEADTVTPLLHYLLECQHTQQFRTNINTPIDNQDIDTACNIAKTVTQNFEIYANTLLTYPPPR